MTYKEAIEELKKIYNTTRLTKTLSVPIDIVYTIISHNNAKVAAEQFADRVNWGD